MKILGCLRQVKTVVCGVSGGVDSAVSALILKLKGYNVIGLFMKNWDTADERGVCTVDSDREDAKFICHHLGIPFHEVNFVKEYWNDVFSLFLDDLHHGRTPNPDVLCNKYIKFNAFHKYATEHLGADAIATGHYVQSSIGYNLDDVDDNKGVDILKAFDVSKCQTLFLSQISQEALRRSIFPVGHMLKRDVKQMATQYGMEKIAKRRESVGICFIGKRNFKDFIEEYMEPRPGNFVHLETGQILGPHKGLHYFTIGQRALIGGLSEAMYIAGKNIQTNDLMVVPGTNHPALYMQTLFTEEAHWINKPPHKLFMDHVYECEFKYQHLMLMNRKIMSTVELGEGNLLTVSLDQPLRSINSGQYAVFYDGDICLGSAKILQPGPSLYSKEQRNRIKDCSNC